MTKEEKQQKQRERELKSRRKHIEFLKKTFGVEEHTKEEAEEVYILAADLMGLFDEEKDKEKIEIAKQIRKRITEEREKDIIEE